MLVVECCRYSHSDAALAYIHQSQKTHKHSDTAAAAANRGGRASPHAELDTISFIEEPEMNVQEGDTHSRASRAGSASGADSVGTALKDVLMVISVDKIDTPFASVPRLPISHHRGPGRRAGAAQVSSRAGGGGSNLNNKGPSSSGSGGRGVFFNSSGSLVFLLGWPDGVSGE